MNQVRKSGFTILELLIVIVIIGILAAITIVSYGALNKKAVEAVLMSDLVNNADFITIAQAKLGAYPDNLDSINYGEGAKFSPGVTSNYYKLPLGYCLSVEKNTYSYRITNLAAPRPGPCSGLSRDSQSAIKWSTWIAGTTGSATNYGQNGDGNSRINDINPWGYSDVVWDVSNQDAASDADGGWAGTSFAIDNSKTYRFSVFVRRKNIGNGSFYLGLNAYPDTVLNRSNSASNTNPYFTTRAWWGSANQWYLVVGHVWPAGSGSGSVKPDSAIYAMDGTKLITTSDFVWQPTTTTARHRSYLYYSTNTLTNQQFYQPRVDLVDGNEPSIKELLSDLY